MKQAHAEDDIADPPQRSRRSQSKGERVLLSLLESELTGISADPRIIAPLRNDRFIDMIDGFMIDQLNVPYRNIAIALVLFGYMADPSKDHQSAGMSLTNPNVLGLIDRLRDRGDFARDD